MLAREAKLSSSGVVLGPLDALEPERPEQSGLLRKLCAELAGVPLIVYGARAWDPFWARESPVVITVPPPDPGRRTEQWERALGGPLDDELAAAVAPTNWTRTRWPGPPPWRPGRRRPNSAR